VNGPFTLNQSHGYFVFVFVFILCTKSMIQVVIVTDEVKFEKFKYDNINVSRRSDFFYNRAIVFQTDITDEVFLSIPMYANSDIFSPPTLTTIKTNVIKIQS